MRIAVCDDDRAALARLASLLESDARFDPASSVQCFQDGGELVQAHRERAFDVVFLDIIMPAINGMDTARLLRNMDKNVRIVFLTSSPEYAVESYSVKASNYLLKPIDPKALAACMEDIGRELAARAAKRMIAVKGPRSVHSLNVDEIEYLEARGKRVRIFMRSGGMVESVEPFHALENKLDPGVFIRTCRGFLVNANCVFTFTSEEVTMRSGERVPLSRSCRTEFKDAYFFAMFGNKGGTI